MPPKDQERNLLITAGPTQEPIDEVRFVSNRSSGRLGIEIAQAAARADWSVTLLLGPTAITPADTRIRLLRFRTASDLQALLKSEFPTCHALVMAAAVSDYRPKHRPDLAKIRRSDQGLTLELEPVPDLLRQCAAVRSPAQVLIGFALEPEATLDSSASAKLQRKRADAIVANPLRTMDSERIQPTLFVRTPTGIGRSPWPETTKQEFANHLIRWIEERK